jgi:hypothetical protein
MSNMNSPKTYRRYVLVDRYKPGTGVRRLGLAPVTGMLEVAPATPVPGKTPAA